MVFKNLLPNKTSNKKLVPQSSLPEKSPIRDALSDNILSAKVCDVDKHRSKSGINLQIDYIIIVESKGKNDSNGKPFSFKISKTYVQFRELADSILFKKETKFSLALHKLINSEKKKVILVNFSQVTELTNKRRPVIDDALQMIMTNFRRGDDLEDAEGVAIAKEIETFFLSHVVEDGNNGTSQANARGKITNAIKPISRKRRLSTEDLAESEKYLKEHCAKDSLVFIEDETSVSTGSKSTSPNKKHLLENRSILTCFVVAVGYILHISSQSSVTVDKDVAILICFVCFCIGVNISQKTTPNVKVTPTPHKVERVDDKKTTSSIEILKKSFLASMKPANDLPIKVGSSLSLARFREGVDTKTSHNCWSEPDAENFSVRGADYLIDKIKVSSGPFLLPCRGADLFLTDACPGNVGRNEHILAGELRNVPTFIINFILPWGALILYHEIPPKFRPFLKKCYSSDPVDLPSMESFTSGERTLCRFFMGDDEQRKSKLKIIPLVIEGPMIVRTSLRGKPVIIGKKLPVNYTYQPAEPSKNKKEYFELDLDIAALPRARKILALCRSYTQSLTLDVGFVVQGDKEDELPEQMLGGVRFHGIDPLRAHLLPPMPEDDNDQETGFYV